MNFELCEDEQWNGHHSGQQEQGAGQDQGHLNGDLAGLGTHYEPRIEIYLNINKNLQRIELLLLSMFRQRNTV